MNNRSVIGQLSNLVPSNTQTVLLMLVKVEQGSYPDGHYWVTYSGRVIFKNGSPPTAPQILVPLNDPYLTGLRGLISSP